ncbi:MAG: DtxR family transcriptional regulator [Anaerolineales bacterium]|jgi:DtxR family Mn-dependent transcriptional regulator
MSNPLIALIVGLIILAAAALIFWPDRGIVSRLKRLRQMNQRALKEDALKHIYKLEARDAAPTLESVAGLLQIKPDEAAELLTEMEQLELISVDGDQLRLTAAGAQAALHVIRAHRMWERYLADTTGFRESDWHDQAEIHEHALTPEAVDELSAQLGHPTHDPHGDPIPTSAGSFQPHGGQPLPAFASNETVRIVHIEDEPETVYTQLVAEGLYPGMSVRLVEISPRRVRFLANGEEHLLAPLFAANISAVPMVPSKPIEEDLSHSLNGLKTGEVGEVVHISGKVRGPERRRLMDMGILPGTKIEVALNGPAGDPKAYLVRGTLIALRKEQAELIAVRQNKE